MTLDPNKQDGFYVGQIVEITSEINRAMGTLPKGSKGTITHVMSSSCAVHFFGTPETVLVSKKTLKPSNIS